MSKSKRKPITDSAADPVSRATSVLAVALVVLRWLTPTESAAEGDTLWIVQLWFATALLWTWSALRSGSFAIRFSSFDVALWTVVLGHMVSTSAVFITGGDRRAALDMAWEWIGLGTTFFVLRQVVQTSIDARRLASVLVVLGVVLAGLGVWQHYFFYPGAAAEYRQMISELKQFQKNPTANATQIGELELKMQSNGIPGDEIGRRQYENRLEFSTEPFGPFALANTFGGFLLVAFVVSGEWLRTSPRPFSKRIAAAWGAALLLMLYCLVLTKSRTAWIGLLIACGWWGTCLLARRRPSLNRRVIVAIAAVAAIVAVLFFVASTGRGFDWLVISESSKSLEYRLQYWAGALSIIRDHPLLGIGPGNFRHHYLQYKLPAASEEIADPHNMILDLWTSGGILAVLGFLGCVILAFRSGIGRAGDSDSLAEPSVLSSSTSHLTAITIGFLLAIVAPIASGTGDFDAGPLPLFLGGLAAFGILCRDIAKNPKSACMLSGAALGGAAIGLLIHLLGAGGIETPAIVQLFLVLAILMFAKRSVRSTTAHSRLAVVGIGVGAATLFVCSFMTATLPILQRRALIADGNTTLILEGNSNRAISDFEQAAVRDPFSSEPPERLADVFFSRWRANPATQAADFEKSVQSFKIAMKQDPQSPTPHRRLGEIYLARFARFHNQQDAQSAADALSQAIARYPNDSALRALSAFALFDAGQWDKTKAEANRAFELDEINHQYGHTDRYLPDATVARLQRILERPAR